MLEEAITQQLHLVARLYQATQFGALPCGLGQHHQLRPASPLDKGAAQVLAFDADDAFTSVGGRLTQQPPQALHQRVVPRSDQGAVLHWRTGAKLRRWTGLGPCKRSACKCSAVG